MKKTLLFTAALAPSLGMAAHELPIQIIEVTGEQTETANNVEMNSQAPLTSPIHDAGALLRSINGMDAARRGGRGFDPVIRGQSENQINVITNGGYNFGSCPSRMDPPSTYVGFDNFDKVTVIKGNRSVIYGAGGSGGTLIFEHQRPDFSEKNILGSIVAGYTSNSDIDSVSANLAVGNDDVFVRVFGEHKSSGHYEDADGNTVSAAFDSKNSGIIVGGDVTSKDYLEASFEQANEEDIYYAGNGMDAPYADSDTARIRWTHNGKLLFLDSLDVNAYRSDVDHVMDNYTLRDRNPDSVSGMVTPSSSHTSGGRVLGAIETQSSEIKLGLDYLANDRQARMYMDTGKDGIYDMLGSYMWPDVEQTRLGIFVEWDYLLNEEDTLRIGIRHDQFEMEASEADHTAGMMGAATPTTLYQAFYGTEDTKIENDDTGVVLGWDRQLEDNTLFSANLSRSVRQPDTNEAFMARRTMNMSAAINTGMNMGMGMNPMPMIPPTHWVGNPDIQAEIHQQLDLTLMSKQNGKNWSATVFWNEVDDYIERYQDDQENTLYRNISASMRGVEFELGGDITTNISGRAGAAYTRGKGENGDLANIAPLTGKFNLEYQQDTWGLGSELIAAQRQKNIDPDVDVPEETPGFAAFNLYSHWDAVDQLTLEAGIENVFDRKYAYHVNKASVDPFDPTAIRVNEPGRQYWVRLRYEL